MGTVVVGILVLGVAAFALCTLIRDKKNGKCCSGSCGSCKGCGRPGE